MERLSVFKNEDVLSYDYLPEILPHRESQIKQLSENLTLLAEGRKPQNIFIFGAPGIGKTVSIKYVFRKFEEYSGLKTLYINCWGYNTATSVLSKIAQEIGYPVSRRGWPKDEIVEKLIETYNKNPASLVVCLDEADQLIYKDPSVIYDLTRMNQYLKKPMMIIFISNNPHIFVNIEPRIKSSLSLDELEFRSYSITEMKDIIKQRSDIAFFSIEQGVTLLVANIILKYGSDVRTGIDCLLRAGRLAEKEQSDKLKVSHVREIVTKLTKVKQEILKQKVNENEKLVLEILGSGRKFHSSELYREYCRKMNKAVTERMFNNYIDHLMNLNLISIRRKEDVHGFTRIISKVG